MQLHCRHPQISGDFPSDLISKSDETRIQSLGNNFNIQIGNDTNSKEILGLTLSEVNEDFNFGDRIIKLVNNEPHITKFLNI
jgi:hypothetical protein